MTRRLFIDNKTSKSHTFIVDISSGLLYQVFHFSFFLRPLWRLLRWHDRRHCQNNLAPKRNGIESVTHLILLRKICYVRLCLACFLSFFFCYVHIISDTIVHISVDKCIESNSDCHQKCWKPCKWKWKNKQRNKLNKEENVFFVDLNCEVPLASINAGTEIHKAAEVRYILTPSKSIKIFLVCSDIEYFDNFQVQH